MKYAVFLCLAAISYDALAMNGYYRNRAGASLSGMSDVVGKSLWARLS